MKILLLKKDLKKFFSREKRLCFWENPMIEFGVIKSQKETSPQEPKRLIEKKNIKRESLTRKISLREKISTDILSRPFEERKNIWETNKNQILKDNSNINLLNEYKGTIAQNIALRNWSQNRGAITPQIQHQVQPQTRSVQTHSNNISPDYHQQEYQVHITDSGKEGNVEGIPQKNYGVSFENITQKIQQKYPQEVLQNKPILLADTKARKLYISHEGRVLVFPITSGRNGTRRNPASEARQTPIGTFKLNTRTITEVGKSSGSRGQPGIRAAFIEIFGDGISKSRGFALHGGSMGGNVSQGCLHLHDADAITIGKLIRQTKGGFLEIV